VRIRVAPFKRNVLYRRPLGKSGTLALNVATQRKTQRAKSADASPNGRATVLLARSNAWHTDD
jgi:hypothetical protein